MNYIPYQYQIDNVIWFYHWRNYQMCKTIDSEVILSYALSRRSQVTLEKLRQIQERISQELSDINVDITRNSLRAAIQNNPHMFKVTFKDATTIIGKVHDGKMFFGSKHLAECYSHRFADSEIKSIKKIIYSFT